MNGNRYLKNFTKLIATGQLTDDPKTTLSPMYIRIIEVMVILAVMYGGFKVTFNNLRTDVGELKVCEKDKEHRVTVLETNYVNIDKALGRIERKLDNRR